MLTAQNELKLLRQSYEEKITMQQRFYAEQKKETEEQHRLMRTEFENLSNRIFKEKTEVFKSPMHEPSKIAEHDLFIQYVKLKKHASPDDRRRNNRFH
ncbi:MAG: hypothetical protein LBV43_08060 [Prevotella sp.]|nr:hypothetical protein [Prevotella sp.]